MHHHTKTRQSKRRRRGRRGETNSWRSPTGTSTRVMPASAAAARIGSSAVKINKQTINKTMNKMAEMWEMEMERVEGGYRQRSQGTTTMCAEARNLESLAAPIKEQVAEDDASSVRSCRSAAARCRRGRPARCRPHASRSTPSESRRIRTPSPR